jgi:hypothetical protein
MLRRRNTAIGVGRVHAHAVQRARVRDWLLCSRFRSTSSEIFGLHKQDADRPLHPVRSLEIAEGCHWWTFRIQHFDT